MPTEEIIVRPARASDTSMMGDMTARAYYDSLFTNFDAPFHKIHYDDYRTTLQQSFRQHFYDPRYMNLVAILSSQPDKPIGCATFSRLGNDTYARAFLASRDSLSLRIRGWFYHLYLSIRNWMWPDRSVSAEARKLVAESGARDEKRFWSGEQWENRWQAQSIIVDPDWQRQGIGKKLMQVILDRATEEGVPVALKSSPQGEGLYRVLGFRLLGRFDKTFEGGDQAGGYMMWEPETKKI